MTNRTARGQPDLVGVRDHRGVEQGGGLDGVLLAEVGADEPAPGRRQRLVVDEPVGDQPEARVRGAGEVAMPGPYEVAGCVQRVSSTSASDSASTRSSTAVERDAPPRVDISWPGQEELAHHAARVGAQDVRRCDGPAASSAERSTHGPSCGGGAPSWRVDSAASVDSAPWFSLHPVRCRPSKPPPVVGS